MFSCAWNNCAQNEQHIYKWIRIVYRSYGMDVDVETHVGHMWVTWSYARSCIYDVYCTYYFHYIAHSSFIYAQIQVIFLFCTFDFYSPIHEQLSFILEFNAKKVLPKSKNSIFFRGWQIIIGSFTWCSSYLPVKKTHTTRLHRNNSYTEIKTTFTRHRLYSRGMSASNYYSEITYSARILTVPVCNDMKRFRSFSVSNGY